jgi:hypothetical protein
MENKFYLNTEKNQDTEVMGHIGLIKEEPK